MTDAEEIVKAAASVIAKAALNIYVTDPHRWSDRPCPTCRQITAIIGDPFGCYEYQRRKKSTPEKGLNRDG